MKRESEHKTASFAELAFYIYLAFMGNDHGFDITQA
jgi:hypothetical protein